MIRNKRYLQREPDDPRKKWVPIGCGECIECRKLKVKEWLARLTEELKNPQKSLFVTLTFKDEILNKFINEYEKPNLIAAKAIELFRKRWHAEKKASIKYWLITELGDERTERLHLHGIIWGEKTEDIEKIWGYGHIYAGTYVNEKTIRYIVKYVTKQDEKHPEFKGKIFCSKGIGKGFINEFNKKKYKYTEGNTKEFLKTPSGLKVGLPIYYRNKLWNDDEREDLWMERLNKKERFVCGERIDISTTKGIENYYKCLEYHQLRTKRLGYKEPVWDNKKYKKNLENINNYPNFEKKQDYDEGTDHQNTP